MKNFTLIALCLLSLVVPALAENWSPIAATSDIEYALRTNSDGSYKLSIRNVGRNTYTVKALSNNDKDLELFEKFPPGSEDSIKCYHGDIRIYIVN